MKIYNISLVVLLLLLSIIVESPCPDPQKKLFLSFNALSSLDHLLDMFNHINSHLNSYNVTTTLSGETFSLTNFKPTIYYNDHHQSQKQMGTFQVIVTLGQVYVGYDFDYEISSSSVKKVGKGSGQALLQQSLFKKDLVVQQSGIVWTPKDIQQLVWRAPASINHNSNLTQTEVSNINMMINDHTQVKLKTPIMEQINELYDQQLQNYLNRQEVLSNANIQYRFGSLVMDFTNLAKGPNINSTGFQTEILFDKKEQASPICGKLPEKIDTQFGGVQQIYTMKSFENIFNQALKAGLFTTTVDYTWVSPLFQFRMGDLGNSVQYANTFPANDQFHAQCHFPTERMDEVTFKQYGEQHSLLWVTVPEICRIHVNNKQVIEIDFDLSFQIKMVAMEDYMVFQVMATAHHTNKITSIDEKFKVTNDQLAEFSIRVVLDQMKKRHTLGTNWKIHRRRYPAVRIQDDHIIIFDISMK